jgi:hypothetical protein
VQLGEVDDDVAGGPECDGQGPAAAAAGRPILITGDAQNRELFVEGDDPGKLVQTDGFVQGPNKTRNRAICGSLYPELHGRP